VGQCPTWWPPFRILVAPSVQRRKVWLTPTTGVPCSNAVKTQNPLKLAGVPKLPNRSQSLVGRSFPYYGDMCGRYRSLTSFFDCRYMPVAKILSDKAVRWCTDGDFLRHLCVLYFQPAPCSMFQTCILNSHYVHTMCIVDIQSATAEIRRGKKKRRKKIEETTGQKYNGLSYSVGRP